MLSITSIRIYFLSCWILVLSANGHAQALKDTTFRFAISYQNIPLQINLHQVPGSQKLPGKYELSLSGNKLEVSINKSAKDKPFAEVTGFSTAVETAKKDLPVEFAADIFQKEVVLLLVSHTTLSGGTAIELLNLYNNDASLSEQLSRVYQQIKQNVLASVETKIREESRNEQQQVIREINRRHNETIDSLLNVIDEVDEENRYGGQFEFADTNTRSVRVYHTRRVQITEGNPRSLHYIPYDTNAIAFYPRSIVIRTFNNFIDHIHVDGYVKIKGAVVPVTFYNSDFSISLRSIFERKHYLAFRIPYAVPSPVRGKRKDSTDSIQAVDYKTYLVNISDLIKINSYKNHVTFMARNDSYRLDSAQKFVRYHRRTFYDYLNVVTFLDFLGVVEKTPNSLIQIEGRIRLPLRLRTSKFLDNSFTFRNVFFPKLDGYLNASFINGSSADTRFGNIFSPSNTSIDTLYIDNFDLIRKNNIRTGLEMGIWKRELKNSSLNLYLDYGIHFVRTNFQYRIINPSDTDEVRQFNTWSMSHGPIARLEFRPDQNLGMDLSFSYNLNQRLLINDNDNLRVVELKGPIQSNPFPEFKDAIINNKRNRNNYKIEFNTYFMLRPSTSNGGLYFRLSNYLSHDFKQIFPQVLVGYSTRLSGMVKNLKDKNQ